MADQVPIYDPDGNIIGYVSTKEISEGLHVQRVLPSDEAGTTLALATSAKQDIAKGVLDAIAASAASVETDIASVAQETGGNLAAAAGVLGTTADAKIETDASGTISGKLRGVVSLLVSLLARVPALVDGRVPVDGSGVTQPISAAALPLPAGAATAAKQPALGTAGAPSADVLTVQGRASMTPVLTTLTRTDGTPVNPDADPDDCWTAEDTPAVNTKATCVKAATADKRHVCTGITVSLAAGAVAPTAVQLSVSLIEDAGGTPSTRWSAVLALQAVAGDRCGVTRPCWIPATAVNKSLTLEITADGGANTYESVAMEGITLSE
jgi:hypothetical protein